MQATILFGSNSGDKKALIQEAIQQLLKIGKIVASSSFYETEPWGFDCQENFLNQVIQFETALTPAKLLQTCLAIETSLGRVRTSTAPRYSSRPIDIDLLFCDSQIINTPTLTIPHPRIGERNFVLVPLVEIMSDFPHPISGKPMRQLLQESIDPLQVTKI